MRGQPRVGARKLTATRSRDLPKAASRARQPKPSARAVSLGSAMRRLALEAPSRRPANYPSTAPGEGGQPENVGIRHSSIGRTSARIGVLRLGVGASRAFVARGRISGAGEARVSGLGLAGDCVSSVAKRWPKVAERNFFLSRVSGRQRQLRALPARAAWISSHRKDHRARSKCY